MRDFVTCEKSALTLRLNVAKGYVDGGKLSEFEQMLAMYVWTRDGPRETAKFTINLFYM